MFDWKNVLIFRRLHIKVEEQLKKTTIIKKTK